MTAYANAERLSSGGRLRSADSASYAAAQIPEPRGVLDVAVIDGLLARLADLVVDRLTERTATASNVEHNGWMNVREAATYLGVHRDTLRKLAAQRAIPTHQDAPGCKLYFRRDELDDWRRTSRTGRSRLRAVS